MEENGLFIPELTVETYFNGGTWAQFSATSVPDKISINRITEGHDLGKGLRLKLLRERKIIIPVFEVLSGLLVLVLIFILPLPLGSAISKTFIPFIEKAYTEYILGISDELDTEDAHCC